MSPFKFNEKHLSQVPALQMLAGMGYLFLSPKQALAERQGKAGNVLLEGVLREQLKRLNVGLKNKRHVRRIAGKIAQEIIKQRGFTCADLAGKNHKTGLRCKAIIKIGQGHFMFFTKI